MARIARTSWRHLSINTRLSRRTLIGSANGDEKSQEKMLVRIVYAIRKLTCACALRIGPTQQSHFHDISFAKHRKRRGIPTLVNNPPDRYTLALQ
jgi:hypothetical protein